MIETGPAECPAGRARKLRAYAAPVLVLHGAVSALTANGSEAPGEGAYLNSCRPPWGYQPNCRRKL
ncbi:MAG: hypothetical protein J0M21_05380 [Xanthomonadales bacterium]|nr:hypothetical protein [Xanthomonadales bacterium]